MHLVRYRERSTGAIGLAVKNETIHVLQSDGLAMTGFAQLLKLPLSEIRALVSRAESSANNGEELEFLSPCDGRMEVWAAGVTYLRSRDARIEESVERSVYDRVYHADRPELFFKSVPWRTVTDGAGIAVRRDSALNVPEPELALVINAHREIVGYTICNDVSSRSIEGENPLYLPQAKIYTASCAMASTVRPVWEVEDPYALRIRAEITRGSQKVWRAEASTALLHRKLNDLVDWLFAQQDFPEGVVLSTGTCLVPPMDVTLLPGDNVLIRIDEVGELANYVDAR